MKNYKDEAYQKDNAKYIKNEGTEMTRKYINIYQEMKS